MVVRRIKIWKRRGILIVLRAIVIGSEAEGSFSLAVRRRVSDSREWETPYRRKGGTVLPVNGIAKESWKRGTKKISRFARNDYTRV